MNYDEVTASFADYVDTGAFSPPTVDASPARRLRDALEPIAMHSVWSRSVNEAQAELGLDFLSGYVLGRAAGLGQPEAGVVVSSFAVFEPGMLTAVYDQARQVVEQPTLVGVRTASAIASLRSVIGEADVRAVANDLRRAVTEADGTGRPLFAGFRSQPWPDEPIGQLWHGAELFREHRGDSHVAVCVAAGLDSIEMNILTECWVGMPLFSYTATRAWSEEDMQAAADRLRGRGLLEGDILSAAGKTFRDGIETQTDQLQHSIVETIGESLDAMIEQLNEWSAQCVAAGAFPPDPFKRAAG